VDAPGLDRIADGLAQLQKEKGVIVAVAWPAVAGEDCYDDDPDASAFIRLIRTELGRRGIKVLGGLRDTAFPESALLDSPYHLKEAESRIRTERLIAAMEAAGVVARVAAPAEPTREAAARALRRLRESFVRSRGESLRPLAPGRFAVTAGAFE